MQSKQGCKGQCGSGNNDRPHSMHARQTPRPEGHLMWLMQPGHTLLQMLCMLCVSGRQGRSTRGQVPASLQLLSLSLPVSAGEMCRQHHRKKKAAASPKG